MGAGPALGQAPSAGHDDRGSRGFPEAPSWWGAPGRAGSGPDLASGVAYPWTLAGHVRGAWSVDDPDLASLGPFPEIMGVQTPLGWLDSLRVESGGEAGWDGFQASLARIRVHRGLPRSTRGRTPANGDLVLGSGSGALDGNGLTLTRGDSASWWRVGAQSWNRGGLGNLAPAGRHHYAFSGGWTRGRQDLRASLAQAGSAAALVGGESQAATGAGGALRYQLGLRGSDLALELARGYDHHESFGGLVSDSRRDAHQRRATAELLGQGGAWGARVEVRDEWVTRFTPGFGATPWKAASAWVAGRAQGRRGPAWIQASLGAGRHGGVERTEFAPSLRLRFGERGVSSALHVERVLAPVWSDLANGEAPFLQNTWKGGIDLAWRGAPGRAAALGWVMGHTRDRALVTRYPFEELWLRDGFRRDPDAFDFGLATASGDWRVRAWSAHGEIYSLVRDPDSPQAAVEPTRGGRASLETAFRAFVGDLGVRLRADVGAIGGRETQGLQPRWISGELTYGVSAALTLSDATVSLRFRNLENKRRPLPWTDPQTGEDAVGDGMEFRLGMAWRLYN